MSETREYKGTNGTIVISGSEIRIERTGVAARIGHGRSDDWRYPIYAVAGISVNEPKKLTNGWISIRLGNDPEPQLSGTTAATHANTVLFASQHRERLDACVAHLEVLVEHNRAHNVDPAQFQAEGSGGTIYAPTAATGDAIGQAEVADVKNGIREDIHEAGKKMGSQFGSKREIKRLEGHLHEGESVRHLAKGRYESTFGLVALTNHRLIFLSEGIVSNKLEDFPLDKISSIQTKSGMMFGELKIYASGNSSIIDQILKQDQRTIAEAVRQRIAAGPEETHSPAPTAPHAPVDVADQLGKFAALRDQGVITDEEFAAQKSKLLGM